ncbi:GNAT family N-acetyltransferase [Anaeromicrobium sediminis]|uniref:N-acetyltransferase domain-containing protein n=1 Tax=Anaeromicrobium sediminis TaxID=1478221 RepID=A0A267MCW0_9FIRM|nr:GNAT family N-acetyltransferase [Anaeromicrobium sediminis]PAB57389.1 hypothetical protein CCE28_19015 [Anaeromicrobium sediminis]
MSITIEEYSSLDELEWLDAHASVMVDSYAWWVVLHKKPKYENQVIDLIAKIDNKIVGFITVEMNSEIIDIVKDDYGFVWEFGVHRNYRGNNIGYLLIEEVHKIMKDKFNTNKSIWYSQDERAQKYYEKLNMREITRHWQFTIEPNDKVKNFFNKDNVDCWEIRGACNVNDFENVSSKYEFSKDDTLMPRLCIGYEYIL